MEDENPEEKARRHKEQEVTTVKDVGYLLFVSQNKLIWFSSLKLKPLYKELLYTIAHKMGKPSFSEDFTDDQLQQYVKEVNLLGFTQ